MITHPVQSPITFSVKMVNWIFSKRDREDFAVVSPLIYNKLSNFFKVRPYVLIPVTDQFDFQLDAVILTVHFGDPNLRKTVTGH
jgi:hypothetical protein